MNYQFLVDAFHKERKEKRPFPIRLEVKNVSVRDARLQFNDWLLNLDYSALGLNHLSADSLDAEVDNLALTVRHCDRMVSGGGMLPPDAATFWLEDIRGRVILTPEQLALPEVYLALPATRFHATQMLIERGDSTFLDPSSEVSFRMQQAHLSPVDLALFVPKLRSFRGFIGLPEGNGSAVVFVGIDHDLVRHGSRIVKIGVGAVAAGTDTFCPDLLAVDQDGCPGDNDDLAVAEGKRGTESAHGHIQFAVHDL